MNRRGEFDLIAEYFAPLAATTPGSIGLKDDAAVIDPPAGRQIVTTVDALVEGVHFTGDESPDLIARKLLRVNLSDLAAMGARPFGYLLTLALPGTLGDDWLSAFASGLAADQHEFNVCLLGGDTVSTTGPLTLTLTAIGTVSQGKAVLRLGAEDGDLVLVSGTIGDAALGLQLVKGTAEAWHEALDRDALDYLRQRYELPQPRLGLGEKLAGLASAALDVSDGLVADLTHLSHVSGVAVDVVAEDVPLSAPAIFAVAASPDLMATILGGGDDYELAFTTPAANSKAIFEIAGEAGIAVSQIGIVRQGEGVTVLDRQGYPMQIDRSGWQHF